jgi:uncharacterized membrane protein YecN with MAPEG domain
VNFRGNFTFYAGYIRKIAYLLILTVMKTTVIVIVSLIGLVFVVGIVFLFYGKLYDFYKSRRQGRNQDKHPGS